MGTYDKTPTIGRGRPTDSNDQGTAATVAGLTTREWGADGIVRKVQLTFDSSYNQMFTDATGNIYSGGTKVYTFPKGAILVLGAVTALAVTRVGTALPASASVVASLGTVTAAADATLTSTEADIVASTAATLTSGVGAFNNAATATLSIAGSASNTTKDVFLNFAASATSGGNDNLSVVGTLTITYIVLGSR